VDTSRSLVPVGFDHPTSTNPADPNASDREPTEREWEVLRKLAQKAESLRGLPFKSIPEVRIQSPQQIRDNLASDYDDAEVALEAKRLIALGLLDPTTDLRKIKADEARRNVLGYYDPKTKRLVVRNDVAISLMYDAMRSHLNEAKATIVHELVHALQDQHFDLQKGQDSRRTVDEKNAFAALVEGDATLVMVQLAILRAGYDFDAVMRNKERFDALVTGRSGRAFGRSSRLMDQVSFRYRAGVAFAAALHHTGGWSKVNRAYGTPPDAAAEVIDPSRYLTGEQQLAIDPCAREPLEKAGFRILEEEVLGQLMFAAFIGTGAESASALSNAWIGDRFWLVERKGKTGYAWIVTFYDRFDAAHTEEVLQRVLTEQAQQDLRSSHYGRALLLSSNLGPKYHQDLETALKRWVDKDRGHRY
jgi:hypothetical protein